MSELERFEDDVAGFYLTTPGKLKVVVKNIGELDTHLRAHGGAQHVDRFPLGPMQPMELIARVSHGDKTVTDYYAPQGTTAIVIRNLLIEK